LALFTRKPEDKRCKEVCNAPWEEFKLRCAFRDARLVLIYEGILILLLTQLKFSLFLHQLGFALSRATFTTVIEVIGVI
jgi:hypothetical protein